MKNMYDSLKLITTKCQLINVLVHIEASILRNVIGVVLEVEIVVAYVNTRIGISP